MISNPQIAKEISSLMLEISAKIDESIAIVQSNCPEEEFRKYRLAAGRVMGEALLEILNPLYEKHSFLKPPGFE
jgi:hypothetical protein